MTETMTLETTLDYPRLVRVVELMESVISEFGLDAYTGPEMDYDQAVEDDARKLLLEISTSAK